MNTAKILNTVALCLVAITFHSQHVSCGLFKMTQKTKKDSSDDVYDITENPSSESSAPVAKSDFVFESSTWDDSQLASAVLFVKEFCKAVKGDKFNGYAAGKNYTSSKCRVSKVLNILELITRFYSPTYGPGSVAERKEIPGNMYEGQLESEKFDVYNKWLVENIPVIKASFKNMIEESLKMTKEQLKTDTSVGPLKYGFVFKDVWGDSSSKSKLQGCISKLIDDNSGSLGKLKSFLFNPSTPSSAGATAGGVFTGLFGLGGAGAGAAYGLNLFGFKNLVTGFLK
ncbi:secreted antigen 1 [Babesia divergens]|uniref:Secreted antigen 1 n=1 Tax=Babesia divergens TaxID=32595 RepID=A0AAD9LM67_BABDI|nr:secreted antigen 1 [Babesia divergens]